MRKIFVVAAMIIGSQLFAQDKDSSKLMDYVTVTASKFSTKTTQTGKVVILITRQDIEHAGSRDLAQVITELGGVFINGFNSNLGKEKNIYLRGARVDYTLITIDGVPVYDASGIGSNFDIRNISIDNVERIEILKGSQSTLYGSDAMAGVINIITKKGGAKPFAINGVSDYGSFNTFRGNLNLNGSKKEFDYNIGYSHVNTDGFSEAKKPDNSNAVFDKDGYHQNSVNANFGLQAGKIIRIQPFLRYTNFKGDLDQDAFVDEKDFTNTNKNLQTGIHNIIAVGKGRINVQYQFVSTKRFYLDDSIKSRNGYYTYYNQAYKAQEHFAETFIVYPFNKIKLTVGSDFRSSSTGYNTISVSPPFPPYVPSPTVTQTITSGDSVKQNQVGAYAALNYSSNSFNIEGGGRWNHHSEYGSNFAFNINPSYFIDKTVKVCANLSSGYKTPSLYQLFSLYGNKTLKPENSLNGEGGLQAFSKNEKSSLRVVYFSRSIKDVIAFLSISTYPYGQYINQDKQKDHGFEVEASSKLIDKIQLKLIYNYVNGEITTKQNGKDTTYFNLLRRPKNTFNVFVGSQLTKALYVNAQLNAVGERKDVYYDPATFVGQSITLKSYVLINFYAEYTLVNNRVKVFADLRNILNKDYSDIYGYNTAGFNAYGGVRFNF
jgi:vitamin B12 transporter